MTPANIFPKSLKDNDAIVDGTETRCNHPTNTLIHFSVILSQEKLNTYHFAVLPAQEFFIAIPKNVTTVMIHKTKVVLRSLFIGLTYCNIFGEIDPPAQSINNQNKFPNNIIMKNQATNGKKALENFLSWNESDIFLSKIEIKSKTAIFNFESSFCKAFFANIEKIKTISKNKNEATLVLLIGPYTVSHWIFGICGQVCSVVVSTFLFSIGIIFFLW